MSNRRKIRGGDGAESTDGLTCVKVYGKRPGGWQPNDRGDCPACGQPVYGMEFVSVPAGICDCHGRKAVMAIHPGCMP